MFVYIVCKIICIHVQFFFFIFYWHVVVLCCVTFCCIYCSIDAFYWSIYWSSFLFLLEYFYFPGSLDGEESSPSVGDPGLVPGSQRPPGAGNGNPL